MHADRSPPQRGHRLCARGPVMRLVAVPKLFILALAALLLHGCSQGETPVHVSQFDAFGTRVDMQLLGVSEKLAGEIAQQTATDFALIEYALGLDQPGPMQRTNELLATTEPFAAPPSLLPLLRQSQALAARSDHLFNPAIGLLTQLWQPDPVTGRCEPPPDPEAIARILEAQPRLSDLSLNGIELLSDNPAVKLDLGAVTRAYAADLAITNMRARGMRGAMIRIDNDLRLLGDRAGQPWRVPVLRGSGGAVLGTLNLRGDTSVITVGRFQKPCVHHGEHFARAIDPRTGYPAQGTQMVTVVHPGDAVPAAAAAAALFVAGPEQWGQIGQQMGITAALLIDETGQVHLSPAMARLLQVIDRNAQVSLSPAWQDADID
ncbi:Thiamine biosynthesis lipoprotein ApbE precursor [Thiorhodovibrio winogradskyi]|uniref:FAD:protein FMN transferase n=1 Tax=Thiorhodovibrio winogradskyi TaxID=77007 RepID=A0ABZ0SFC6_9GAMM|nr:FAD:protein FMN transferase [Thiorhodovibrio winogradskyi]